MIRHVYFFPEIKLKPLVPANNWGIVGIAGAMPLRSGSYVA